jgi:hypothetical protein
MEDDAKSRRKAWRVQARKDLRRPRTWIAFASLYVATFLLVTVVAFILKIVPDLPWISKPYVDPDPPPLVLGFYCANLIPAMLLVAIPALYAMGGQREIPFLSSKKNRRGRP